MKMAVKSKGGKLTPKRTLAASEQKSIELPDGMSQRIAKIAYELWEQRGRREGYAHEDWLDAEAIVMEELHEARE